MSSNRKERTVDHWERLDLPITLIVAFTDATFPLRSERAGTLIQHLYSVVSTHINGDLYTVISRLAFLTKIRIIWVIGSLSVVCWASQCSVIARIEVAVVEISISIICFYHRFQFARQEFDYLLYFMCWSQWHILHCLPWFKWNERKVPDISLKLL